MFTPNTMLNAEELSLPPKIQGWELGITAFQHYTGSSCYCNEAANIRNIYIFLYSAEMGTHNGSWLILIKMKNISIC
jgi:hypothetical protein